MGKRIEKICGEMYSGKFFCVESERKGTCYHEFQRGSWDEKTFWKEDSLFLHDDILQELELYNLFREADPEYSDYGETEIDSDKWAIICGMANVLGGDVKAAIDEADLWVKETLKTEEKFTILGI